MVIDIAVGAVLVGRYRLDRELAEGGMGAVWIAHDTRLDVQVAVKLMSGALASSSAARARFEREAKSAARLGSPHVVRVYDHGVFNNVPFLVMELLSGEDLGSRLSHVGTPAWTLARKLCSEACKALSLAHEAGVVHRDLKPSNLFLSRIGDDEMVKVLDFGIAKVKSGAANVRATAPGILLGSPSYMSPEQARSEPGLDHRSDLWSLAVILFECLTGRLPFEGEDMGEVILAICAGPIPKPTDLSPALGPAVDAFFKRALSRLPEERFQTAREMAAAFDRLGPPRSTSRDDALAHTTPLAKDRAATPGSTQRNRASLPPPGPGGRAVIAGRFEIEALAGQGGMGAVHRAIDRVSGEPVALKLFHVRDADRERFVSEARALTELMHPAIVRYVAHGTTAEGDHYLAMEWLDGRDLAKRLRDGPLGVAPSLAIAARVAAALGAAHLRGLVHRDVKPNNVLLPGDDPERAVLIDFGIVKAGAELDVRQTVAGVALGTLGYMAPEQLQGHVDVDARADVFALGCLLFECLTGRPAYMGTPQDIVAGLMLRPPPRPSEHAPDLPPEIDALVERLLARDREARPEDGSAAQAEIDALGSWSDSIPSMRPRPRSALGAAERKLTSCLFLVPSTAAATPSASAASASDTVQTARPRSREGSRDEATVVQDTASVAKPAAEILERIGPVLLRYQGDAEATREGTVTVTFANAGTPAEQATRGALCALEVRATEPFASMALATTRHASRLDPKALLPRPPAQQDDLSAVWIDETTAGLLTERFEIHRSPRGIALQGTARGSGAERRLLGKSTPCVGREPELGMLDALVRECLSEPIAKVAVIVGPAGSGKSRIREELFRRIEQRDDDLRVWIGRGDPRSTGSPFAILAHALEAVFGITGDDPPAERWRKLAAHIAERTGASSAPGAADHASRVALFIADLMGIAPDTDSPVLTSAREDALFLGDQRRRAFEDLLAAELAHGPVALVLEDLHWGDLPTIELTDSALRNLADRPLFVLATARPEVDETFPRLWEARVPQRIRVGPLSPKASEKMVRHVLGPTASKEVVAQVVSRAAGHPLHIEELLRVVTAGGGGELPDTVLALVEARIAGLDPGARRVLRAASILGRTFWSTAVAALLSESREDIDRWLAHLASREWVTRTEVSRFAGSPQYVFSQDLLQEAAYAMLTPEDRAVGHRLAAHWLETAGERDPIVLARHAELGEDRPYAAASLVRAAERALDGNDFAGSVRFAERALSLAPERPIEGRARAVMAEARLSTAAFTEARDQGVRALTALPVTHAAYLRAAGAASAASGRLGDLPTVQTIARALLALPVDRAPLSPFAAAAGNTVVQLEVGGDPALAKTLQDKLESAVDSAPSPAPEARAHVARSAGARAAFGGDPFGAIVALRTAVSAFEEAGDLRSACSSRKTLGWYLGECGALEEGERELRATVATAERLGLPHLAHHARHDLGSPLLRLGKLAEARTMQELALTAFEAQGDRRLAGGTWAMLSAIALAEGDPSLAEEHARRSIEVAPSAPLRIAGLGHLAAALVAMSRFEDALKVSADALSLLAETGTSEEGLTIARLARADALSALARPDEAAEELRLAREEIHEKAARIRDPALADAFLTRIPENARALTWSPPAVSP
ncbi:MAG: protein kinase [Polyangiaceae bacterium]